MEKTLQITECYHKRKLFNLRRLRISLKYRPKILQLILKMRQCIRKKNVLLGKFKKILEKSGLEDEKKDVLNQNSDTKILIGSKDSYTQTDASFENSSKKDGNDTSKEDEKIESPIPWFKNNGETEKSIAEQVAEVAQSALQETGMVYVESAGMYYDYKTGYYYNSELGLYYHTDTDCYYYYSDEKKTFVFHSYPDKSAQNAALKAHEMKKARKHKKAAKSDNIENLTKQMKQENEDESKPKRKKTSHAKCEGKETKKRATKKNSDENEKTEESEKNSDDITDLEDGECSDSSDAETDSESNASTVSDTDDDSVSRSHAPCMRLVVCSTAVSRLRVGSLYVVTKDGGSAGREGDHAVLLKDHNVSRNHLEIKYDTQRKIYVGIDLGSKNGTILNGNRMSESQTVSNPMEIVHGSTLQLGDTKLLCHIHPGNDTCGHCEPGLIMESMEKEKVAYTRTCSVQKQHQLELARLRNKYAPAPPAIQNAPYNDRARARRDAKGSSHHAEKTRATDVHTFIAPENKGFKLLEKMGWSKGEGLGKDGQGEQEPIPLVSNEGTTGLGASSEAVKMVSKTLGPATLRLAARTKMLQPPAKAFQPEDEDLE